jgi:hypothetical protein
MLSLTPELDAFAAKQSKVQEDLERTLSGSARVALRKWGQKNWYKALLERGEKALRARYRLESGKPTSPAVRMAVLQFRRHAETVIKKTKKPTEASLYKQAKSIAASLSVSAINLAVIAAGKDDERTSLDKIWLSMEDEKVRPTHAAAHGQRVPYLRLFTVGGHKMSVPGDLRAPIKEWINCRCLIALVDRAEASVAAAGTSDVAPLDHTEELGVTMATKVKDPVEEVQPVEEDWSDFEDSGPSEVPAEPIPWYGPLAPEGVASGDGRKFAEGALSWRDLPLPFAWQRSNEPGHDGSVVVGNIQEIWRTGGLVYGSGVLLPEIPETEEFVTLIVNQAIRGISVDADDATVEFEMRDGGSVDDALDAAGEAGVNVEDIVQVFTQARICGATGCAIPAFQEAFLALGYPTADIMPTDGEAQFRDISSEERKRLAEEGKAMPDGSFPIANVEDLKDAIQSIGRAEDPDAAKAHIKKRARDLGHEELIPEEWAAIVAAAFVKTEDGPGWLTHPVDTDRLRDYWVRGPGAAKIGWGTPGDFNRCRANLAKYIKPNFLAGYCANRHYDALGFWPGRPVSADTQQFSGEEMTPMLHLVAAAPAEKLPASWFRDPLLIEPTALSVTEEGQVFGHVATWGTCHIGITGTCVTPPHSETDYAYFKTGAVLTDEGEIAVGHLTVGTGHADPDASALVAMAHYDNTGAAVADVVVGEDDHGIWVAGAVRPHATPEQIHDLRASALSGDWRRIGSNLEMVAALGVNIPGFPIPRMALAASGGVQQSLVASGIVTPVRVEQAETSLSVEEIVDLALQRQEERMAARRPESLARKAGRDPASKMKRLAAARNGGN